MLALVSKAAIARVEPARFECSIDCVALILLKMHDSSISGFGQGRSNYWN